MMKEIQDRLTTKPSEQLTAPHLRKLIWWAILLVWAPFAALPAVAAMAPHAAAAIEDPLNIPPVLMGLAMVISSLAGATALLMRIDRELSASPDKPLPRPWIMSTSHMLGAWLAGTFAFIVSRQYNFDVWPTLGMVLGFSFGNAKLLEAVLEKYLPSRIHGAGATPKEQP
ncbi:hypothetical protein BH11PSE13_BH11PSE13_12050 [soil metagenome]